MSNDKKPVALFVDRMPTISNTSRPGTAPPIRKFRPGEVTPEKPLIPFRRIFTGRHFSGVEDIHVTLTKLDELVRVQVGQYDQSEARIKMASTSSSNDHIIPFSVCNVRRCGSSETLRILHHTPIHRQPVRSQIPTPQYESQKNCSCQALRRVLSVAQAVHTSQ